MKRFFSWSIVIYFVLAISFLSIGPVSAQTDEETISALQTQVADLQADYDRKVQEASKLRKQRNEAREDLATLQAEYDVLVGKYYALVTPTAAPTLVPTAVPTEASGCATSAELDYLSDANVIIQAFVNTYSELNDELSSGEYDIDAINDLMAKFPGYYQDYLTLSVPSDRLQNVYDHSLATLYHMNQATGHYAIGMSTFDEAEIEAALAEIQLAGDEATKAANALTSIKSELCL